MVCCGDVGERRRRRRRRGFSTSQRGVFVQPLLGVRELMDYATIAWMQQRGLTKFLLLSCVWDVVFLGA